MYSDKAKSKAEVSDLPAWLEPIIGPLYVDFVAPFPLETTLKVIKRQETSGFFRLRKVSVDLIPEDADTFGFYLKKWGNKYATTEARGFLKRWNKNSTLVKARVNVAMSYYLMYAVLIIFFLFMGAFMFRGLPYFGLVLAGVMILNWFFVRRNRNEVASMIENALLADLEDDFDL
jgi:hypothetical protein